MPIRDTNQRRIVDLGTGDTAISITNHPLSAKPNGLYIANLMNRQTIGEAVRLKDQTEIQKDILFQFNKLSSLDVLLSQMKLLRGSMADGEMLHGQQVTLIQGSSISRKGTFVRLLEGDVNKCQINIGGRIISMPHNHFVFDDENVHNYFNSFYF